MPKIYCPHCGFGTEYKLGSSPKSCSKCHKSTVIEVKSPPKPAAAVFAPPPPTKKGKWILVDEENNESPNGDDTESDNAEYSAPEIKIEGVDRRQEAVKLGDIAHQQKTGEAGRQTQKLSKRQAKESVESALARAKGKTEVIEFN